MIQSSIVHRIKRYIFGTKGFKAESEEEMTNGCRNCELYKMFVELTRKSVMEDLKGIKPVKMQGQASQEQDTSTIKPRYPNRGV